MKSVHLKSTQICVDVIIISTISLDNSTIFKLLFYMYRKIALHIHIFKIFYQQYFIYNTVHVIKNYI